MARANQSAWSTRQLVTLALLTAIAILLSFVEFPIFPAAPFLKYDASFVPIMVAGFAYGPGSGVAVGVITWAIHGLMVGDPAGAIMNIIAMLGFVLPAAIIYKRHHTFKGALVGLIIGIVLTIVGAIVADLVVIPLYNGTPVKAVITMIIPILLPFNALKAVINAVLTLAIYKAISNLITPVKDQVKGR